MNLDKNEGLIEKYIGSCINEPSIGLCQIQKHIKHNTPVDLDICENIKKCSDLLMAAVPDIENTINEIRKIKALEFEFLPSMEAYLDCSLNILEKIKK